MELQHISSQLPGIISNPVPSTFSKELVRGMLPEEREMIELKHKAKPFGAMKPLELEQTAAMVMLRLHVITGWAIPQKELGDILQEELQKKLLESYAKVNADEIFYAFRNAGEVKEWGKAMNLMTIDEVMIPYLNKRSELSRVEEQAAVKMLPAPEPEMISDQDFIESVYQTYRLNKQMRLIPELAYQILEPVLSLTRENKARIKALIASHGQYSEEELVLLCRQYAVSEYFDKNYKK